MRRFFYATALRRTGWAVALYTLLALLLTWPLAAHFVTHVAGDGIDDPALAWNLWWAKVRLVEQLNPDLFHGGWMFHPVDINLAFYTLTPLNGLLSIPLQLVLGLTPAANLLLLLSFVLSALGAYLLVRQLLRLWDWGEAAGYAAALLAGGIYAFASAKLFYAALGQFNIASSHWIPFCALYLVRMAAAPTLRLKLRPSAMAGLFLVFQAWSELTYASFLLLLIGLLFVWELLFGRGLRGRLQTVAPYILLAFVFLMGVAPFLAAMAPDLAAEGDFFGRGGGFADVFSADLQGYLAPTRLHPLLGDWAAELAFPNDKGQHIYAGYAVLLLAACGAWGLWRNPYPKKTRRWLLLWGGAALLFWLLTLGPEVRWGGASLAVPGPFTLVSQLPFFSGNRYPSRYSVMLLLALAVLAGAGAYWLLTRRWIKMYPLRAGVVSLAAVALLLFEHLSIPLSLSDQRVPRLYTVLASEVSAPSRAEPAARSGAHWVAGTGALLELPTGWRNGARVLGKSDLLIMAQQWYQTEHGLRRLGGNTSRNPEFKFQYFTDAPLLGDLIALFNADQPHLQPVIDSEMDAIIARNRPLAGAVLDFLGVEFVTVHVEQSPPQLLRFVDEVLPLTLLKEEAAAGADSVVQTIRLYRVDSEKDRTGPARTEMQEPLANLYLGEGWSPPAGAETRYATRSAPALLLNVPATGGRIVLEWGAPLGELTAAANGRAVPAAPLDAAGWRWVIDVPEGAADPPVDRIALQLPTPGVAAGMLTGPAEGGGWPVGTTGVQLLEGASLLVRSAGEETGDFAHIWVNGADVAGGERGYNLAALDPGGKVLGQATYDTSGDMEASSAMATWLRSWPAGTIIAGAVADDASLQLQEDAVAALREVGVNTDLRGKLRWSHAFAGAVGAPPGSALEDASLLRPAIVGVGPPVDGAVVFGQLRALTIEELEPGR